MRQRSQTERSSGMPQGCSVHVQERVVRARKVEVVHRADDGPRKVGEHVEGRERVTDQVLEVHRVEVEHVERHCRAAPATSSMTLVTCVGPPGNRNWSSTGRPVPRFQNVCKPNPDGDGEQHREVDASVKRIHQRLHELLGAAGLVGCAVQNVQHVRPFGSSFVQRRARARRSRPAADRRPVPACWRPGRMDTDRGGSPTRAPSRRVAGRRTSLRRGGTRTSSRRRDGAARRGVARRQKSTSSP